MPKKPSEDTEKRSASAASVRGYRCRVEATVRVKEGERSIRLGPGLLVSQEDRDELVNRGFAPAEWFVVAEKEEA